MKQNTVREDPGCVQQKSREEDQVIQTERTREARRAGALSRARRRDQ